ncbi:MAG: hypothetical protein ACI85K_001440 [Hyphomicrobiaceae bacterium]|jgi:hypothetical protein
MRLTILLATVAALGLFLCWSFLAGDPVPPLARSEREAPRRIANASDVVRVDARRQPPVIDKMPDEPVATVTEASLPAAAPHTPPTWLDAARFEALGIPSRQAEDLVTGLRQVYLQRHLQAFAAQTPEDPISVSERVFCSLGEQLLTHMEGKRVQFEWKPRNKPWPRVAGASWHFKEVDDGSPRLTYTVHGRFGFATLRIPESLFEPTTWRQLVAAHRVDRR